MRQKIYSAINVLGLAIGIAASTLIAIYINNELSYDRFHEDADRISRIASYWKWNDFDGPDVSTSGSLLESLKKNLQGIESATHLQFFDPTVIRLEDKAFIEDKLMLADSSFFDLFNFKLISGDPKTSLSKPNTVVITLSTARKYFGFDSETAFKAIGRTLIVGRDKLAVEITAIAEDVPDNSHFHFNVVLSSVGRPVSQQGDFEGFYTYIKLKRGASISTVEKNFPRLVKSLIEPVLIRYLHQSLSDIESNGGKIYFFAQPLTSIHLNSQADHEIEKNGDLQYCYLMGVIALIIIILASVNFINLSTARAIIRGKEIGIRKAVGALRSKIIKQHLLESYLYTFCAFVLALTLISLTLTPFNILTYKNFTISALGSRDNLMVAVALFIVVGLLTGVYPAFYLTRLKPTEILRGKLVSIGAGASLRSKLVLAQFIVSISLAISAIFIYQQVDFMLSRDTGFRKESVLYNLNAFSLDQNKNAFLNELQSQKEIISCSFIDFLPTDFHYITLNVPGSDRWIDFCFLRGDHNLAKTIGLEFKHGRYFSTAFPSDSSAVVINETAAELLGIGDLSRNPMLRKATNDRFHIIGIIKDINFESLRSPVKPMIIFPQADSKILIKLTPGNKNEKIALVRSIWKKYTDAPFEYGFLDEKYASLYRNEQNFGSVTLAFSILTIIISCLGLFGLVTYIASQRTKEIGIRKVMGASVRQVVMLLSKDFVKMIFIAFIIAIPISWYGMNEWLETFAYRIDFDVRLAVGAGVAVLIIALLTVTYQSVKAAVGNPVDSLRSE